MPLLREWVNFNYLFTTNCVYKSVMLDAEMSDFASSGRSVVENQELSRA